MGIDVWVLRENHRLAREAPARVTAPAKPARGAPEQHAPVLAPRPSAGPVAPPAAIPEFHLGFVHGAGVSLVYTLPPIAGEAAHSVQRFAGDVLFALTGEAASSMNALRWPMVQSRHIDQSAASARLVIEQRMEQCAPLLLLFGHEAAELAGDVSPRRHIQLQDITSYLQAPLGKRDLWQALVEAQRVMSQ